MFIVRLHSGVKSIDLLNNLKFIVVSVLATSNRTSVHNLDQNSKSYENIKNIRCNDYHYQAPIRISEVARW